MRPGRFFTICLLYLGGLAFANAILSYVLEPGSGLPLVMLAVGIGPTVVGVERLRNPGQEERPGDYGPWTYALVLFLAGFTAWLAYELWLSVVGASP